MTDIAAQYRLHADKVANGEISKPARSLLIEVDANGVLNVENFGAPNRSHREVVAFLADCIRALGGAVHEHNASASN